MALRPSRREMSSGRMTGSLAVPCLFPPGRPGLAGAWPCPGSPRTERRDQGLGHGVESSGGGWLPHSPCWRHGRWPHWRSEEHVHAHRTTEANPADDGCRTDRSASPAIGAGGRGRSRRRAPAGGPDHWRAHPRHEHRDRAGCRQRPARQAGPDQGTHGGPGEDEEELRAVRRGHPRPGGHLRLQRRRAVAPGHRRGRDHDRGHGRLALPGHRQPGRHRSEEHTSELQSRENLVCRLLLEKKKKKKNNILGKKKKKKKEKQTITIKEKK